MDGIVVNGRPVPVHCLSLARVEECLWVRLGNWGETFGGGGCWGQVTWGGVRGGLRSGCLGFRKLLRQRTGGGCF